MNEAEIENFLEHSGVKGMHWGHHKSQTPGPSTTDIHMARARQQGRKSAYRQALVTGDRAGAGKAAREFQSSHDRVIAAHMTKGEKAATVLLGGGLAGFRASSSSNLSRGKVAADYVINSYTGVLTIPIQKRRIKGIQIQQA